MEWLKSESRNEKYNQCCFSIKRKEKNYTLNSEEISHKCVKFRRVK